MEDEKNKKMGMIGSTSTMRLPKAGTVEIAPSILNADFGKLADEIAEVEAAGVKMLHLDVMDGHFVPNISIGPPVIAKLHKFSHLVLDAHLMITEPAEYAPRFIEAGVNNITFHIEAETKPRRLIDKLHEFGCTAGIALNPETPVKAIEKIAPLCDMVLVMSVHPGFGGQAFMPDTTKKITKIREIVGPDIRIEVDGGIDQDTAPIVVGYGADTLVVGNAIFSKLDRKVAIDTIWNATR